MLFLVDLPNPVHGMSNVNRSICSFAEAHGYDVVKINTAPSYWADRYGTKYWGWVKLLHTIVCIVRLLKIFIFSKSDIVYRAINGGKGQVYDIIYLIIIRIFRKKIVLHHHSFNYINRYSRLFDWLNKVAGGKARHVVLGEKMKAALNSIYSIEMTNLSVVSNVAFFEKIDVSLIKRRKPNEKNIILGHLANISVEKGIDEFISTCKKLSLSGVDYRAKIAGPLLSKEVKILVESACLEIKEMQYLGGLYDAEKEMFFKSLDVFVFPSKYKNEAEPLVLYEAGKYGVLSISTRIGCIEEVLDQLHGKTIAVDADIASNISQEITSEFENNGFSDLSRKLRAIAYNNLVDNAKSRLINLFNEIEKIELSRPEKI